MMRIIRKTSLLILLSVIILFGLSQSESGVVFGGEKNARAFSPFPYQTGGKIIKYTPSCTVTTGTCNDCPLCTGVLGSGCGAYEEIVFQPFSGSMGPNFICVSKGYPFLQGTPAPGLQIMAGGVSNTAIWLAAVSP